MDRERIDGPALCLERGEVLGVLVGERAGCANAGTGRDDRGGGRAALDRRVRLLSEVGELLLGAGPVARDVALVPDLVGADGPAVLRAHRLEEVRGIVEVRRRGTVALPAVGPRRSVAQHVEDTGAQSRGPCDGGAEFRPVVDPLGRLDLLPGDPDIPEPERAGRNLRAHPVDGSGEAEQRAPDGIGHRSGIAGEREGEAAPSSAAGARGLRNDGWLDGGNDPLLLREILHGIADVRLAAVGAALDVCDLLGAERKPPGGDVREPGHYSVAGFDAGLEVEGADCLCVLPDARDSKQAADIPVAVADPLVQCLGFVGGIGGDEAEGDQLLVGVELLGDLQLGHALRAGLHRCGGRVRRPREALRRGPGVGALPPSLLVAHDRCDVQPAGGLLGRAERGDPGAACHLAAGADCGLDLSEGNDHALAQIAALGVLLERGGGRDELGRAPIADVQGRRCRNARDELVE